MRLHFGKVPEDVSFDPMQGGWIPLKEPQSVWFAQLLSLPLAIIATFVVGVLWWLINPVKSISLTIDLWVLLWLAIGVWPIIVVHESLHLVVHPSFGLTESSVVGVWPSKLAFYVNYEGPMSRSRFLTKLATPFIVLSILPIPVSLLLGTTPAWLIAVSLINAFCACMDIFGILLILFQVPSVAQIRNKGYKSFWLVEDSQVIHETEQRAPIDAAAHRD